MNKGFNDSKDLPRSPLDWDYADRMRQDWKGKFGIKGILTREDAALSPFQKSAGKERMNGNRLL